MMKRKELIHISFNLHMFSFCCLPVFIYVWFLSRFMSLCSVVFHFGLGIIDKFSPSNTIVFRNVALGLKYINNTRKNYFVSIYLKCYFFVNLQLNIKKIF